MRAQLWIAAFVIAGGVLVRPALVSVPASAHPDATQDATTTLDDQTELAVTVYNSDIALVRDVRSLQLARGTSDLRFMDIAATVNPATVHFRSISEPSRVSVLEQNYEYDLLEPDKLLRKYVGREVTLVRNRQESGSTRQEQVKARLLSYNNGPIWQIGDEIVTGLGSDHIRFPELPDNLYTRPTLIWTLQNDGAARHRVEASYLAQKLSWNADYVLTVARDDKAADLDGWVTVTNGSGTSFRNAKLQFVAGDLNRVRQAVEERMMQMSRGRCARRLSAHGAGGVLRLPPLHPRPKDDDQQQPDEAGQHARRHRRADPEAIPRRGARRVLPQRAPSRRAPERRRAGVLPVQERGEGRARHADARQASCASISPIRRAVCNSSARIGSTTRRRTNRCA